MAGNGDNDTIFDDWYRNVLLKRKDSLRGQYVAWAEIRAQASKKMDEMLDATKDCDAQIAKCDEVARKKSKAEEAKLGSKGKEPELGSNYDTPIKVDTDSDTDEEPVRMRRIEGVQGEPSKFRGQCSGTKLVFGAGVESGDADMDISDNESMVKHVIDVTVGALVEPAEDEPAVGGEGAGAGQQGQQQVQANEEHESEEEQEDEEGEAEEQGNSSDSTDIYGSDDGYYGFDSD